MKQLNEILNTMDLPDCRKPNGEHFDLNWLIRNIRFRNNDNPDIEEAIKLIKQEIRSCHK